MGDDRPWIGSRAPKNAAEHLFDVTVFGGALVEQVLPIERLPLPNQANVSFRVMKIFSGGSGGNTAVYLSRLGHRVALMDKWGDDASADLLSDSLHCEGVDISFCQRVPGVPTAYMIILTLPNNDWSGIIRNPKELTIFEDDVEESVIASSCIIHFHGFCAMTEAGYQSVNRAIGIANQEDMIVSMDASTPMALEKPRVLLELFSSCHIVFVNQSEAIQLSGRKGLNKAARFILDHGPEVVIIKAGAEGCYFFTIHKEGHIPPYSIDVVDTIGAGDGVVAGTLSGCLRGFSLIDSVRLGVATASLVCKGMGGQGYRFNLEDIKALFVWPDDR